MLAQLDDALYRATLTKPKLVAQRALAELDEAKAKLELAESELKRVRGHVRGQDRSCRGGRDGGDQAAGSPNLRSSQRRRPSHSMQALLKQAEINLAATTIRSPIKGIVIDRRVNLGQTVEPSLNAPSLFLIAKESKGLQIWASVNEADIGKVHEKQSVRFTVEAFPGKVFEGQVTQVRLNAQMTQNVVTYTVVITTENADGRLLPYLTANVAFDAGHTQSSPPRPECGLAVAARSPRRLGQARKKSRPEAARMPTEAILIASGFRTASPCGPWMCKSA